MQIKKPEDTAKTIQARIDKIAKAYQEKKKELYGIKYIKSLNKNV